MTSGELRERAHALGIQVSYHDVDGVLHDADDAVLARVVDVLEADRAAAAIDRRRVAPIHFATAGPLPVRGHVTDTDLAVGATSVDLMVRHGDDHDTVDVPADLPLGCHELRIAVDGRVEQTVIVVCPPSMPRSDRLAHSGALFVPTYALWEHDRPLPSFTHLHDLARRLPASGIDAVSTLPLYAAFLDDPYDPSPYSPASRLHWNEVYLDDAGLPPAPVPALGDEVDWALLAGRRRRQLIDAAKALTTEQQADLAAFVSAHPDVASYARFRAEREAGGDVVVEQSHVLAQFLADQQLGAIRADPDAAALALDLPIGSHPAGYEVWADSAMFASGMAVGAPPDTFFADGQNWGFPPTLPAASHASGHRVWRQLVERVGRHADVLRIDHAMAIHRLWWVPDGFSADQGVYVHYPRDEILAVLAASAAAAGVTIVGEDLGTVPTEVSEAFARWDVLGMYEEQFHLDDEPLPHIPARTVAGIRTHDMAPLADVVAATDTSAYRARLGSAHGRHVDATWQAVVEEMLHRLAHSDAYMVMADLDDLIGETRPHNLPGRVVPGLWQRRLDRPTSEVLADPDVVRRLSILGRTTR